jgi:DNA invertase Pin-like site-specific DNA recombinase
MSQNAFHQIADNALATRDETRGVALPYPNEVVPTNSAADDLIVQCLIIAARRGRQIRLAREKAAQLQQSKSGSVSAGTLQSDEP